MDQSTSSDASSDKSDKSDPGGGLKDTFESILVAFILAFIFRAFVVEAFVIPTGSMAPTLLGAHMRFTCEDCGHNFTCNFSAQGKGDDLVIPSYAVIQSTRVDDYGRTTQVVTPIEYDVYCPNCGYKVPTGNRAGEPVIDPENDAVGPKVHYGDRILVLKYLYLLEDPSRWDVVVFKSPASDTPPRRFQLNFIKRLVGLPGESIMILDGDIYTSNNGGVLPGDFEIQTKPRQVQDALWRIIYDNDLPARGLPRRSDQRLGVDATKWQQPWKQVDGAGWTLTDANDRPARTFRFDAPDSSGTLRFDPTANPGQHAYTDWLAYNLDPLPLWQERTVSDLKIELDYHRSAGDGPLRLRLSKLGETFVAKITPTQVSLHRGKEETLLGQAVNLGRASGPMHIEFANVDYQVSLTINGETVLQTTPANYAPDIPRMLRAFEFSERREIPSAEISAQQQACTISHLSLWRDVYYTNHRADGKTAPHGSPEDFPQNLMRLGADEYFTMGDNTLISSDARYWHDPIDLPYEYLDVKSGRVPGRFMLGKALFVYWPGGYAPAKGMPGLVPNFGEMRFIH